MAVILPAILFTLLGLVCVALVVVGLPGTWILVLLAILMELGDVWWLPAESTVTFGWWLIGLALLLALLGEGLELVSGIIGTKGGGGTRRGMLGALLGGMAGALVGTFIIPVPVLGTLFGALLGTFVGAFMGETTGEDRMGRKEALKPAILATIGRVLGTVAKMGVATVAWLVLSVAAFL